MERLNTWGVLAVVGAVVGFGVYLMASSHAPAFLAWLAGVSGLLKFIQAGMIGNARNAANRARDEATFYLENFRMPVNHQPVIEPVPSVEPSFIIDEGPDAPMPPAEWQRQKEAQETWRQPAGFKQGHHTPSPTLSARGWYRHPVTGRYVKRQ